MTIKRDMLNVLADIARTEYHEPRVRMQAAGMVLELAYLADQDPPDAPPPDVSSEPAAAVERKNLPVMIYTRPCSAGGQRFDLHVDGVSIGTFCTCYEPERTRQILEQAVQNVVDFAVKSAIS